MLWFEPQESGKREFHSRSEQWNLMPRIQGNGWTDTHIITTNYWRQNSCHLITLSFLMKDITWTQEFTVFSLKFQTEPYIMFVTFYMKFVSLCSIASNLYSYLIKLVTCHCNGYIIISILSLNFTVTVYVHLIHLIWIHSPSMH